MIILFKKGLNISSYQTSWFLYFFSYLISDLLYKTKNMTHALFFTPVLHTANWEVMMCQFFFCLFVFVIVRDIDNWSLTERNFDIFCSSDSSELSSCTLEVRFFSEKHDLSLSIYIYIYIYHLISLSLSLSLSLSHTHTHTRAHIHTHTHRGQHVTKIVLSPQAILTTSRRLPHR